MRYLAVPEAERLMNACDPEFRPLVRAGLETGCRYGELIRLEACNFNSDAGTLAIRQSKSGKPRHVVLTEEGAAFFRRHCAGRSGHELIFRHGDGGGHADTRMVEKHYGHLAPSFIADAIRAGAPRYRVKDDKRKVVPLR